MSLLSTGYVEGAKEDARRAIGGLGPGWCRGTHKEERGGGKVQEKFLEAKLSGLGDGCK